MAVTLETLVRAPALGLRPVAAVGRLDRPVSFAYVSELVDPSPWLDGGELVLTMGLWLAAGSITPQAYVGRLAAGGVAGIGFGIGPPTPGLPTWERVPDVFLAAAEEQGLPVLEVPTETSFLAVSKTIARALAAEEHAAVTEAYEAQQALARAAVRPDGVDGVTRTLARRLEGWVVVTDPSGQPLAAAPGSAASRLDPLADELHRAGRSTGPHVLALEIDGAHVLVLALRSGALVHGLLVVGWQHRPGVAQRHVANVAAALLTLLLDRAATQDAVLASLEARVLRAFLDGDAVLGRELATLARRPLPDGPVRVVAAVLADGVAAGVAEDAGRLAELARVLRARPEVLLAGAPTGGPLTVVVRGELDVGAAAVGWLRHAPGVVFGASDAVPLTRLDVGRRGALAAAEHAARSGLGVAYQHAVPAPRLLDAVPPEAAREFAEALVAPLLGQDGGGRGGLVATLAAWLGHNGQWDATAVALGVHRHTVRHRIARVEELLGCSLDAPTTRMELWAALLVLGHAERLPPPILENP